MNSVIAWVLILIAGAGLAYTAWSLWSSLLSRTWPSVSGRVISSRVEAEGGGRGGPAYRAAISYEYEVGGRKYHAHRAHFGDGLASTWGRRLAQREVKEHPSGASVSVHFNPRRPAQATLETGLRWYFLFDVLFWAVFLTIPVLFLHKHP